MHLKRWITSLIALPVIIYMIVKGGVPFMVLIGAVCALSLREYYNIVFPDTLKNSLFAFCGLVFGTFALVAASYNAVEWMMLWLALDFVACGFISVCKNRVDRTILKTMAYQVLSMIYIPLLLAFLVFIRMGENGTLWVFYLLVIVFSGDVGAYYVGTYLGQHKLIPAVSPKKTVEGALGGIGANLFFGSVINMNLPNLPWGWDMPSLPWLPALLFFALAGISGQFGDLFESLFKRAANVKDSGNVLPGHGGMLDRIDALLFAAPVAYVFNAFIF